MAVKLERFPALPNQRHPWADWLDGSPWMLTRGEDYGSKTTTLISNARIQARRRGGSVRTRLLSEDGIERCVVQFVVEGG